MALFCLEAPEFAFLLLTIRRRLVFSAILPSCLAELSLSAWSDHRACAAEASIATEMAGAHVDIAEFDRKRNNKSSIVWQYYGFKKVDGKTDKTKVVCRLCLKESNYNSTTTNMRTHLDRHHWDEVHKVNK